MGAFLSSKTRTIPVAFMSPVRLWTGEKPLLQWAMLHHLTLEAGGRNDLWEDYSLLQGL